MTIEIDITHPPDVGFDVLEWTQSVLNEKSVTGGRIDINFVPATYIHQLNKEHLSHDYVTDILTFSFDSSTDNLEGDIYICPEQAAENATAYGVSFSDEIRLLIVHGVLHLLDYRDYTDEEKTHMHAEQDRIMEVLQ